MTGVEGFVGSRLGRLMLPHISSRDFLSLSTRGEALPMSWDVRDQGLLTLPPYLLSDMYCKNGNNNICISYKSVYHTLYYSAFSITVLRSDTDVAQVIVSVYLVWIPSSLRTAFIG